MARFGKGESPKDAIRTHKTFADDEDRYWEKMGKIVTTPLAEVLKGTNEILRELRDQSIAERAAEAERRRSRK